MEIEIVSLSGSTKFEKEYHEIARRMTLEGKIILMPHVFDKAGVSDSELDDLVILFERCIDLSDRLHIVDIGGYIGENTKNDIDYALSKNKEVTFESEL